MDSYSASRALTWIPQDDTVVLELALARAVMQGRAQARGVYRSTVAEVAVKDVDFARGRSMKRG